MTRSAWGEDVYGVRCSRQKETKRDRRKPQRERERDQRKVCVDPTPTHFKLLSHHKTQPNPKTQAQKALIINVPALYLNPGPSLYLSDPPIHPTLILPILISPLLSHTPTGSRQIVSGAMPLSYREEF
jgi:hypothetical protein